jgi:glucose/arabinose dehydrogenase
MRALVLAALAACALAPAALAQPAKNAAPRPQEPEAEAPQAEEDAAPAAPPADNPPPSLMDALAAAGLDPHTKVADGKIQVMLGQRAVFHLDAQGAPVLDEIDAGRVGLASPDGKTETYKGVPAGRIAFALDAAPQRRQSVMKIWNGSTAPAAYAAEIVAVRQGQLMRRQADICVAPAGGAGHETWPDPVVAITLSKIADPPADKPVCQ